MVYSRPVLLTCNVSSIADLLKPRGKAPPKLKLSDVPRYVYDDLGLHGITLSTDLLVGSNRDRLAALRDQADKSRCPCIMLIEHTPVPLAVADADKAAAHLERLGRVIEAAHLLGCNAAALQIEAPATAAALELAAPRLRKVMDRAEKLELNVLIRPAPGLTGSAEDLTEFLKKVGGFRVGVLPDFQFAAAQADPVTYLKRITPYASVVLASTVEFGEPEGGPDPDKPGSLDDLADLLAAPSLPPPHLTYDLAPLVGAIAAVGFDGTLAIDYRGGGDGTLGVLQSRDALDAAIEATSEA